MQGLALAKGVRSRVAGAKVEIRNLRLKNMQLLKPSVRRLTGS